LGVNETMISRTLWRREDGMLERYHKPQAA